MIKTVTRLPEPTSFDRCRWITLGAVVLAGLVAIGLVVSGPVARAQELRRDNENQQ